MKRSILTLTLSLCLLTAAVANAQMKNALGALAVSPDNKLLLAAGVNRVLYEVNPETLEVTNRHYINMLANEMYFSNDGGSVVVVTGESKVAILNPGDWKHKADIESVADVAIASEADKMVVLHRTRYDREKRFSPIAIYEMSTGKKLKEVSLEIQGEAIGVSPDASTIVLLSQGQKDESEPKEQAPRELRDLERDQFDQTHDGYSSEVVWLDGELNQTARNATYYQGRGTHGFVVSAEQAQFIVYDNECVKFSPDGSTELFRTAISYNYGIGTSNDAQKVVTGGLGDGMIMNMQDMTSVKFQIARMPGYPEYFYGFTFGPDGSIYGGTNAFRVIKLSADGEVLKEQPIF
ncbi:MAG: hypothetical protein R3C03_19090 [Pirellulaceae bacterium]